MCWVCNWARISNHWLIAHLVDMANTLQLPAMIVPARFGKLSRASWSILLPDIEMQYFVLIFRLTANRRCWLLVHSIALLNCGVYMGDSFRTFLAIKRKWPQSNSIQTVCICAHLPWTVQQEYGTSKKASPFTNSKGMKEKLSHSNTTIKETKWSQVHLTRQL